MCSTIESYTYVTVIFESKSMLRGKKSVLRVFFYWHPNGHPGHRQSLGRLLFTLALHNVHSCKCYFATYIRWAVGDIQGT